MFFKRWFAKLLVCAFNATTYVAKNDVWNGFAILHVVSCLKRSFFIVF